MNNKIENLSNQKKSLNRKTISINMDKDLLQNVDDALDIIQKAKGNFYSRNTFIEVATRSYLSEIKKEISELDIEEEREEPKDQVIVFTCSEKGKTYDTMFKNNYWSCVPLGKEVVNLINNGTIKYFALYRGIPRQYIDSYAEIIGINKLPNDKYRFELGEIKMLPNPVSVKNVEPSSIMKGRKISLTRLLTSTAIDEF